MNEERTKLENEEKNRSGVLEKKWMKPYKVHIKASEMPNGDAKYVEKCAATETTDVAGGSTNAPGNKGGRIRSKNGSLGM